MKKFLAAVTFSGLSSIANAGLMDVSYVTVENAGSDPAQSWLQIAELQLFDTTSTNVATSGTASAFDDASGSFGTSPSLAIDGSTNGNYPNIYHELGQGGGVLDVLTPAVFRVDLAVATELSSFAIWGRTDCCSERDVYNIEFFNANNESLYLASGVDASGDGNVARGRLPNSTPVPSPTPLVLLVMGLSFVLRSRRLHS